MMNIVARFEQLRYALQKFCASLPEEEALEVASVYPSWNPNSVGYKAGDYVTYGENSVGDPQLYVVILDHTSQEGWTPDVSASLFKAVGKTSEGYDIWVQPVGATDAYMQGDIVSHNDKLWISDIDSNIWEPGVYGWSEYIQ